MQLHMRKIIFDKKSEHRMPNTYFISDVHLGMSRSKSERVKEKRLISFLEHVATTGERLFIVGDLFDFWFEYRTVIPRGYTHILCALSRLQELGVELHYVAGNHDFWIRDFLTAELNVRVHFDPIEFVIDDHKFYIHHGDGLAKKDVGYRFLKRVFRNRTNIFLYSLLHPDIGIPLARWVSSLSRNHTSGNRVPDDTDYIKEAIRKFQEGCDYAIFGHLHMPNMQIIGEKIYVNLGDWIDHFTYALYDGKKLELLKWN